MCRMLIVEDELIERMVLKKTLLKKFKECEIIDAENGREALDIFQKEEIDIAILDIEMPGIKGIEVAERMRRESKNISIIFLTAYDKFEYARKAVSVRAMEYLLKPYSEKEIVSVVDEAVRMCEEISEKVHAREGMKLSDKGTGTEMSQIGTETSENGTETEEICTETQRPDPKSVDGLADDENVSRLKIMVGMIEEYIKSNYMYDISMQDAAQAVNYSEPYFCKMFKMQYGQSFTSYLTDYRIEKAKKMLMQPTVNVKIVGERVGYLDSNYFARVFRRVTGVSPSEYRNTFLKSL